jgi:hypothetical protein
MMKLQLFYILCTIFIHVLCSGFYAFSQSQPTLDSLALSIKSSDDSPEKLKSLIELAGQYKNHSQRFIIIKKREISLKN